MSEQNDFALVPRSPSALEKAEPGAKRIMSGMVADTLALAKPHALRFPRVVHFDDEFGPRESLRFTMLNAFPGLELLDFADADAAWAELSRADPDLFITDVNHPGMKCADMLSGLAERKVRYHILVLSGYAPGLEKVRRNCDSSLNISFMLKPPTIAEFIATVGHAVQMRPQRAP